MNRLLLGLAIGLLLGFSLPWFFDLFDGPAPETPAASPLASPSDLPPVEVPIVAERSIESASTSSPTDSAAIRTAEVLDEAVPHSEIRGRLVARDGTPIEGARVLAIATRHKYFSEGLASVTEGNAETMTHRGGAFALFGLENGGEYALFADVRDPRPGLDLAGPARGPTLTAPAHDVEVVDTTCWLLVSFELDAELARLADADPTANVTLRLFGPPPSSSNAGTSLPLRGDLRCRVPADVALRIFAHEDALTPVERDGIVVPAAEGSRRLVLPLEGYGAGNVVRLTITDESRKPLDSAAIAIVAGADVPAAFWTSAPSSTESRLQRLDAGMFIQKNVTPGPNTFFVAAPLTSGLAPFAGTIHVAKTGEQHHEIVLERGGRIVFEIAASAVPVTGASVILDREGSTPADVWLNAEGDATSTTFGSIIAYDRAVRLVSGHAVRPGDYAAAWLNWSPQSGARMTPGDQRRQPFRVVAGQESVVEIR